MMISTLNELLSFSTKQSFVVDMMLKTNTSGRVCNERFALKVNHWNKNTGMSCMWMQRFFFLFLLDSIDKIEDQESSRGELVR